MTLPEVVDTFVRLGFKTHETKKVVEFKHATGTAVYLVKGQCTQARYDFVVHPDFAIGGFSAGELYHNSNMRAFPLQLHGGCTEIHYGRKIVLHYSGEVQKFAEAVLNSVTPAL